jgi:hypothetical protein
MRPNRRPLLALAAVLAVSSLLSACIVVPRGHYRYYRHADASAPAPAPHAAPTAPVAG